VIRSRGSAQHRHHPLGLRATTRWETGLEPRSRADGHAPGLQGRRRGKQQQHRARTRRPAHGRRGWWHGRRGRLRPARIPACGRRAQQQRLSLMQRRVSQRQRRTARRPILPCGPGSTRHGRPARGSSIAGICSQEKGWTRCLGRGAARARARATGDFTTARDGACITRLDLG
jgi:hypothetical protein